MAENDLAVGRGWTGGGESTAMFLSRLGLGLGLLGGLGGFLAWLPAIATASATGVVACTEFV